MYDGEGKKVITYPRTEITPPACGLAEPSAIPVSELPVIRRGASGTFHDKGLAGASHHAGVPNVNTVDNLRAVWPPLSVDERRLFDLSLAPRSDPPAQRHHPQAVGGHDICECRLAPARTPSVAAVARVL